MASALEVLVRRVSSRGRAVGVGAARIGLMRAHGVDWGWPWMVGFHVTGGGNIVNELGRCLGSSLKL